MPHSVTLTLIIVQPDYIQSIFCVACFSKIHTFLLPSNVKLIGFKVLYALWGINSVKAFLFLHLIHNIQEKRQALPCSQKNLFTC